MSELRKIYDKFCATGGSGRSNVNELLKAIVDALDKPTKPSDHKEKK